MSYTLEINEDLIVIEFIGETSLEENESVRQQVIFEMNEKGLTAVLVDMTEVDLSEVQLKDLVEFGNSWEGLLFSNSAKFATLVPYSNPFRDKVDLSLWVGMEKGVQLKIFEEKELAIKWLTM